MPKRGLENRLSDRRFLAKMLKMAENGHNVYQISEAVGCSRTTLWAFLKRNPRIQKKFDTARLRCKDFALANLKNGMTKDWRAAAWWLERFYRPEYDLDHGKKVDLARLSKQLIRFGKELGAIIPDSIRQQVDTMLGNFLESLDADDDQQEGESDAI